MRSLPPCLYALGTQEGINQLLSLAFRIYMASKGMPTVLNTAAATIRQVRRGWAQQHGVGSAGRLKTLAVGGALVTSAIGHLPFVGSGRRAKARLSMPAQGK